MWLNEVPSSAVVVVGVSMLEEGSGRGKTRTLRGLERERGRWDDETGREAGVLSGMICGGIDVLIAFEPRGAVAGVAATCWAAIC